MDKLQKYRKIIRELLTEQAHPYRQSGDVEAQIICDTEHDHYQLTYMGWDKQQRIFSLLLHFDIKDEKIWIQYNGTELAIAQVLMEKGVEKSDIVLGFHSPFKRQYTEFSVR